MQSYLSNRQYKKLTQVLPCGLQSKGPQMIYLPSHNQPLSKANIPCSYSSSSSPIPTNITSPLLSDCCVTCYSIDNISVKYYGKKHVCINCRKFLRDQYGNQVKLFLGQDQQIVCLGLYRRDNQTKNLNLNNILNLTNMPNHTKDQQSNNKNQKIYYHTDFMKLTFNDKSAFATFAAQDQMVVIVRENTLQTNKA